VKQAALATLTMIGAFHRTCTENLHAGALMCANKSRVHAAGACLYLVYNKLLVLSNSENYNVTCPH